MGDGMRGGRDVIVGWSGAEMLVVVTILAGGQAEEMLAHENSWQ